MTTHHFQNGIQADLFDIKPGIASGSLLYIFLGIIAFYTGIQLWHMYLNLDSYEYPIRTYSDLTGRIFGKFARHVVNILQTIQLIVLVSTIIIM